MRILPKKTTVLLAVPLLALALAAGATLVSSGQNPAAPPEFVQDRGHDRHARRGEAPDGRLCAEKRGCAAPVPAPAHALRGPGDGGQPGGGELPRARRRRLHLRLPGHPRPLRVRGHVRHAAAAPRQERSQGDRREHGRLRHRRLAPGERAGPQRPGRPEGSLLRRLARRHGHARSAPGRQGRLAAGVPGRHVPRRRFPPQRRVPPELRLRVRGQDGDDEGGHELPLRRVRHLRVVSPARASLDGQREIPVRPDPDLERLRRPSQLRRVLAPAGHGPLPGPRDRAHAPRRRLVGPGGLLRAAEDLRDPRAARRPGDQLLRRRSLEPRRLEPPGRGGAGPDQVRFRHVEVSSARGSRRLSSPTI